MTELKSSQGKISYEVAGPMNLYCSTLVRRGGQKDGHYEGMGRKQKTKHRKHVAIV